MSCKWHWKKGIIWFDCYTILDALFMSKFDKNCLCCRWLLPFPRSWMHSWKFRLCVLPKPRRWHIVSVMRPVLDAFGHPSDDEITLTWTHWPLVISQILAVLSAEAVRSFVPCGLKAIFEISPSWPSAMATKSWVNVLYIWRKWFVELAFDYFNVTVYSKCS